MEKLFTLEETAAYFSVNPQTIRNWAGYGIISFVRLGKGDKMIRITQSEIERLVNAIKEESSEEK